MTKDQDSQLREEEFLEYLKTNKNTAAHPRQTEISEEQMNRLLNKVKKRYDCDPQPLLAFVCSFRQV